MKFAMSLYALFLVFSTVSVAAPTRFIAMGDVPYVMPGDEPRLVGMIEQANRERPSFVVHVGDIKGGSTPCTDSAITHVFDLFQRFTVPLIYTPGDNEWTDCGRTGADPVERLSFVRRIFFHDNFSLAVPSIALTRQSADPAYAKFVENARWTQNRVTYATLHVVGSNNNDKVGDDRAQAEFRERNAAVLAWVHLAFASAKSDGSAAVVFFQQADPFFAEKPENRTGFNDLLAALTAESVAFARPVLLVHGDSHVFTYDHPLWLDENTPVKNFQRLEVWGSPVVQSVLVTVDPDAEQPFTIRELPGF